MSRVPIEAEAPRGRPDRRASGGERWFAAAAVMILAWQVGPYVGAAVEDLLPELVSTDVAGADSPRSVADPIADGDLATELLGAVDGFDPFARPAGVPGVPRSGTGDCAMPLEAERLDLQWRNAQTGLTGADYPHAYPLPDGRVLWLAQDVFIGSGETLDERHFTHVGGAVQDGACWEPLPGSTSGDVHAWIAPELEIPGRQWFWPLDGEIDADGLLSIFFVEMHNEFGTGAASGALPRATWLARIDPVTLDVRTFGPAPDASASLYGWSIASDDRFSYLFGHCYRQFVPGALLGADACTSWTTLARVPAGRFDAVPEYFGSGGWTTDAAQAGPVLRGGMAHGASVQRLGDRWVAVTKEDDWFGDEVIVEVAASPEGPWREIARQRVRARCGGCNTYGTFLMPWLEHDRLVVAMSANAWKMREHAFDNASVYRPFVVTVPWPTRPPDA